MLDEVLAQLRSTGSETALIEVKSAAGGCPRSVRETLSAFANARGAVVVLGLDDSTFEPTGADAPALRDALAGMAADDMTPPVRGVISIENAEGGHQVVVMEVPEFAPDQKPCYITAAGRYQGSYTRSDEGDRRLTAYEIDRLIEGQGQPQHDREPVHGATADDLRPDLVEALTGRLRTVQPRAFGSLTDQECLRRANVLVDADGVLVPTLAGLLACGEYPQGFFPQLSISVVVLPGTTFGDTGPHGERFVDNRTCEGPLVDMIADARDVLVRHMSRASVIDGTGRADRLEYPLEVIRELLVNAVMHRDYSAGARGTQVQVELYPDRLVVRSPGGFFGPVDPSSFGEPDVSSSRNSVLARLLSDLPGSDGRMIPENRGSGIPTVLKVLEAAGMVPPEFHSTLTRVEVDVAHDSLLTAETHEWIQGLGQDGLTQWQIQALALARSGRTVRNQTLQGWGAHQADATRELSDLVRRGLTVKLGDRRGARYTLNPDYVPPAAETGAGGLSERQQAILRALADGPMKATEVGDAVGTSYRTAMNALNDLIEAGLVEPTAPPRSRRRRYRLTPQEETA